MINEQSLIGSRSTECCVTGRARDHSAAHRSNEKLIMINVEWGILIDCFI